MPVTRSQQVRSSQPTDPASAASEPVSLPIPSVVISDSQQGIRLFRRITPRSTQADDDNTILSRLPKKQLEWMYYAVDHSTLPEERSAASELLHNYFATEAVQGIETLEDKGPIEQLNEGAADSLLNAGKLRDVTDVILAYGQARNWDKELSVGASADATFGGGA